MKIPLIILFHSYSASFFLYTASYILRIYVSPPFLFAISFCYFFLFALFSVFCFLFSVFCFLFSNNFVAVISMVFFFQLIEVYEDRHSQSLVPAVALLLFFLFFLFFLSIFLFSFSFSFFFFFFFFLFILFYSVLPQLLSRSSDYLISSLAQLNNSSQKSSLDMSVVKWVFKDL